MGDYWKDNNITKPQQTIVCAACKSGSIILCGVRHWDKIMNKLFAKIKVAYPDLRSSGFEQGFVDQFGKFLTREEAMEIVKENGQPFDKERNGGSDKELYSEGLY